MKAQDIMTKDVVTVRPGMTVHQIATLMARKHISGLPVVSKDGDVLGIISESDLIHRRELGTDETASALAVVFGDRAAAEDFAKAHGKTAHDIMSRPVVSVHCDSDLNEVADLLERRRIKRVPVLKDGRLAGIIARSDLIRALAQVETKPVSVRLGSGVIHQAITDALKNQSWLDTSYVSYAVKDGKVHVTGFVRSDEDRNALRILMEEIPGVTGVEDHLQKGVPTINWDGTVSQ
jgi:CBS domain-containing protein